MNQTAQEKFRTKLKLLAANALLPGLNVDDADVWTEDEVRIVRKGLLSEAWALKGARPRFRSTTAEATVSVFVHGAAIASSRQKEQRLEGSDRDLPRFRLARQAGTEIATAPSLSIKRPKRSFEFPFCLCFHAYSIPKST